MPKTKILRYSLEILSVLTFAFVVLAFSVAKARAVTTVSTPSSPSVLAAKTTPSPTPTPTIKYQLPYPGILPDNMFYSLKMLRDKIILLLTGNPEKKAELNLLYSDKRLGAAVALIDGNKLELGLTTLAKGEKYLEQAVREAEKVKSENQTLIERLTNATLKHQEVINNLMLKVPDSAKKVVQDALQYSRQGYETISNK
jgi:hypothetical protein